MVYVTPLNNCYPSFKWPHRQYAHLTADSLEELQTVGQELGLPAWRLQKHKKDVFPRYVITPDERTSTLSSGIQAVSLNRLTQKGV